jgi:hypothetical protein
MLCNKRRMMKTVTSGGYDSGGKSQEGGFREEPASIIRCS